jgi:hypothetical protein
MGSGRSENAADAPKRGAFPAGLIGAEPIDLAAVRQGERFRGQVTVLLKDFGRGFKEGQNRLLFRLFAATETARLYFGAIPRSWAPGPTASGNPTLSDVCSLYAASPRQEAAKPDDALIFSPIWV